MVLEGSACNREFFQVLVLGWLGLIWICEAEMIVCDGFNRRRVWYCNCYFIGGWKDHLHLLDFSIWVHYRAWLHLVFAYIWKAVLCHLGRCRGFVASHSFAPVRWIINMSWTHTDWGATELFIPGLFTVDNLEPWTHIYLNFTVIKMHLALISTEHLTGQWCTYRK